MLAHIEIKMNIIEFNLLKEEIKKDNYQETFDRETISALLESAEYAEKKARKAVTSLLNAQANTIDGYRAKLDLVVERLYDLKYGDEKNNIQDFVYNLLEDLYIKSIPPQELNRDKIDTISTEFQKFRDV